MFEISCVVLGALVLWAFINEFIAGMREVDKKYADEPDDWFTTRMRDANFREWVAERKQRAEAEHQEWLAEVEQQEEAAYQKWLAERKMR